MFRVWISAYMNIGGYDEHIVSASPALNRYARRRAASPSRREISIIPQEFSFAGEFHITARARARALFSVSGYSHFFPSLLPASLFLFLSL